MIAGAIAWDLLLSGAIAFSVACLVFLVARRRMFARRPRLAAFLLALPFVKLVVDLARGVPREAFFWDKLGGAVQNKGSIEFGIGFSRFGPVVNFVFTTIYQGSSRLLSAADGMATLLDRRASFGLSAALGLLLGGGALLFATREVVLLASGSLACRRHLKQGVINVATRRLWVRRVELEVSPTWKGVPVAGGLIRPWICLSTPLWLALSPEEREAVILHELGHLRWFDGVTLTVARIGRALLWFVPWSGAALRVLARECEFAADADAVRRGASPEALASALVRCAELMNSSPVPLLPFRSRERSAFIQRVQRLLHGERPKSLGRLPVILFVMLAAVVLRMTIFGYP